MTRLPTIRTVATAAGAAVVLAATALGISHAGTSTGAAAGFTAGDLVVYRVGDGSTALSGAAAPVFLDEYRPNGTAATSIPLPTGTFTDSGSAASDGELALSADGGYLTAPGYHSPAGTANVVSTNAVTIARAGTDGTVDTSTVLPAFAAGNNVRSAVTSNGTDLWVSGGAGGIAHSTLGAGTSTAISGNDTNFRQLGIAGGQLYASSDKNSLTVATIGSGLPDTAGQTVANLPGNPDSGGDPYAFTLLTLGTGTTPDTLYVADETAGTIGKYGLSGGKWTAEGSVAFAHATGLTGTVTGGHAVLYATSSGKDGTGGALATVTDTAGAGQTMAGTVNVLATAPTNEAFRGVAFAPGTHVATAAAQSPTITTASPDLPGALGDSAAGGLGVTVGDPAGSAEDVTVTATSDTPGVASAATVTGTGANRTLTVTPAGVGHATITLTATSPAGGTATAKVDYAASAAIAADPAAHYYSGAGNGSAIADVGGGYQLVGDDESNTLRLYRSGVSGPPVKTFDFSAQLPDGSDEVDIEAVARAGNRLYWCGSMSNSSSGKLEPARSTVFATDLAGSGADTTLTYAGAYTGLRDDLIAWDKNNSNALGFADSAKKGVGGHTAASFNVEGMEFAPGSTTTAYLAFRGPLESPSTRSNALLVPVTNLASLVTGGGPATFGAPLQADLGGLGIRDIRKNDADQYLIIAGAADESDTFALYSWDGRPGDAPAKASSPLPAGAADGSWESLGPLPATLGDGSGIQIMQDNGNTAWYGDGQTSKDDLPADLQKDLTDTITYHP